MTPSQMLRKGFRVTPLTSRQAQGSRSHDHPPADHVIKILEPPANRGLRVKKSAAEPWLLEALDKRVCPVCAENLLHMCCSIEPTTHFYTCEDSPYDHRWTLLEA